MLYVKMALPTKYRRVPDDKYGVIINASNLKIPSIKFKCYAHLHPIGKCTGDIRPASERSWATFLRSVQLWTEVGQSVTSGMSAWSGLRGQAVHVAKSFFDAYPLDVVVEEIPIPENAGFHRQCYAHFTDSTFHKRAINAVEKLQKQKVDSIHQATETSPVTLAERSLAKDNSDSQGVSSKAEDNSRSGPATKKSHLLRSGSRLSQEGIASSSHVLPDICIICRGCKYMRDRHTGVRRKEPLAVCEQIDGGFLLKAARLKKDEDLLLHIENKDCVAIGLKYHRSCYRSYTKIPKNPGGRAPPVPLYDKAFKVFCADTIDRLIFQDKNVFRMTKLKRIFDRTVQQVEDQDSSGFRAVYLKQRLIKSYPQLCFLRSKRMNLSELVYADSLTREDLIEDLATLKESVTEEESDSDSDSGMQETHELSSTSSRKSSMWTCNRVGILRDRYSTALDIKQDIASIPSNHSPWPPTSFDLSVDDARRITPTKLFNFLAWVVGSSDEPEEDEMVKVADGDERKILTMALDVIYMATRGRKSTPKDVSSETAV